MLSKGCAALAVGAVAVTGANADNAFVTTPALRSSAAPRSTAGQADSAQSGNARMIGGALAVTSLAAASVVGNIGRSRRPNKASSVVVCNAGKAQCPSVLEGTGGPFPEDFWDPAGLCKNKTEEEILYYRAAEIKHGRISMLAVLGWFHNAGNIHYIGDKAMKTNLSDDPLIAAQQFPIAGWLQLGFFIFLLEWLFAYACPPPKEAPWDLVGWQTVLSENQKNPQSWKDAKMQELNNGRLAMLAIIGLISADIATDGKEYGSWIKETCAVRILFPGGEIGDLAWWGCKKYSPLDLIDPQFLKWFNYDFTQYFPPTYPKAPNPFMDGF